MSQTIKPTYINEKSKKLLEKKNSRANSQNRRMSTIASPEASQMGGIPPKPFQPKILDKSKQI